MSILDVLLNRMQMTLGQEPSGDSQIRFHEALVVIEELLFYNKDIMSFFQEEFSTSLGDYNFTVQSSRGINY
jgi:hypothetical protein